MFRDEKYALELYKSLYPRDKNVTVEDIKIITLQAILVNGIYNDLGMLVKNKMLFIVEAQTKWSINILIRELLYLADTYKQYISDNKIDIHSSKKIELPMPELYVVYVGDKKIKNGTISLNKEYFDNKAPIDLKIKVVTKSKKNDIVYQYIKFCKIKDEEIKINGNNKKTIKIIIERCIKEKILEKFLEEHKKEVIDMMDILYDQDTITQIHDHAIREEGLQQGLQQGRVEGRAEGRVEGMQQGKHEGKVTLLVDLYNNKIINVDIAAEKLNITKNAFLKLVKSKSKIVKNRKSKKNKNE